MIYMRLLASLQSKVENGANGHLGPIAQYLVAMERAREQDSAKEVFQEVVVALVTPLN